MQSFCTFIRLSDSILEVRKLVLINDDAIIIGYSEESEKMEEYVNKCSLLQIHLGFWGSMPSKKILLFLVSFNLGNSFSST